jgi:hypothetical protein
MERILRLFAKFCASDGYRQAFHELLVPLYYVAVTGRVEFDLDLEIAEAIAFFMLHSLVNGTVVGDFFFSDGAESVVTEISERAMKVLERHDGELYRHLRRNSVHLIECSFSWITVLFCQIHRLAPLLRLWDFLLCDTERMRWMVALLVAAHLREMRKRLIGEGFVQIMSEFHELEMESEAGPLEWCKRVLRDPRGMSLSN